MEPVQWEYSSLCMSDGFNRRKVRLPQEHPQFSTTYNKRFVVRKDWWEAHPAAISLNTGCSVGNTPTDFPLICGVVWDPHSSPKNV